MKSLVTAADTPAAIYKNYIARLYAGTSLAESYCRALEYARGCHFDVPRYVPIYGVIAERLKASGDTCAFRAFCNAHATELMAEQEADRKWVAQRDLVAKGPSYFDVVRMNKAAADADALEAAISVRAKELLHQREISARGQAFADARIELDP